MEKVTWTYTNMREPQPHSHKKSVDENEVPRNACTRARKPRQWWNAMKWHENDKWAYTNMSEPQPHSHRMPADKNEVPRNACTLARKPRQWWNDMEMTCKHANGISALKYGGKQPRNEAKWHEMQGNAPKCNIRHPKWPIAMLNMHNMDMQCKDRS